MVERPRNSSQSHGLVIEASFNRPAFLPWNTRTGDEWKKSVTKEEAARLFYIVSRGAKPKTTSWIDKNKLRKPLEIYWQGNITDMLSDVEKARHNDVKHSREFEDVGGLTQEVGSILKDPNVFMYLDASRLLLKSKTLGNKTFNESRGEILGLDFETLEDLNKKYQKIVEIFLPRAKRFGRKKLGVNPSLDIEDWEGIAGVRLSQAVLSFNWDTFVLDPSWTVDRFIGYLSSAVDDDSSWKFDTRKLEVTTEAVTRYSSPEDTESSAFKRISEDYVRGLIVLVSESEIESKALSLRIFENLSAREIAEELGVEAYEITKILQASKGRLSSLMEDDYPQLSKKRSERPFWDNLFKNVDYYRRAFENRKAVLRPFHQTLVQKFLNLQTGERDSSVLAVWESLRNDGWEISVDSVRRHIAKGISQLDYREIDNTNSWDLNQQTQLIRDIYQDPNIWETFSEQKKYILKRFFLDGEGRRVTRVQIGKELGVHESTVSREISRSLIEISRVRGSTRARPNLFSKPRNLLSA